MSKAVLISIHPEWCKEIAEGVKTLEVRKSRPKINTPFKCYMYCTKDGDPFGYQFFVHTPHGNKGICTGTIFGEFVCDRIIKAEKGNYSKISRKESALDPLDIMAYGFDKTIYGWYISNLVIYDKHRELREFYSKAPCRYWHGNMTSVLDRCFYEYPCENILSSSICQGKRLSRPPQSWCYVEELP